MKSKPVLCTWELGGGYGHLANLAAGSRALRQEGFEVTLAARDLAGAGLFFRERPPTIVQAPVFLPKLKMNRQLVCLADVLLLHGYGDEATLRALLGGWLALIRLINPLLLVCDYSPTALLAGRCTGIPAFVVGNGFCIPEPGHPLPDWRPRGDATDLVATQEKKVLEVVNPILAGHGAAPLAQLADLFRCERMLLTSFPLTDPWRVQRRNADYFSQLQARQRVAVSMPEGKVRTVVCYLKPSYRRLQELMAGLATCGANVLLLCPGLGSDIGRQHESASFVMARTALDLESALAVADLFISHGGLGGITQGLRLGLPQLVLPQHMEQLNTGMTLFEAGLGRVSAELEEAADWRELVANLLADTALQARARAFAAANAGYARVPFPEALAQAAKACLSRATIPSRP